MPFGLPLFYRTVISRYTAGLKPRGIPHPGKLTPLSGIAKEVLPAGALRSNVVGTCGSPTNAPSKNAALRSDDRLSLCDRVFFIGGLSPF